MFGLFKSKPILDSFYLAHKVTADREPFLCIGALLIETNQFRDSLTLLSRWPAKELTTLLGNAWGIDDRDSTKDLLEELLLLPSLKNNEELIRDVLLKKHAVQDLIVNDLLIDGYLFDSIGRTCKKAFNARQIVFTRPGFDALTNIASWDIERAGLIVRYAYNVSWLTEAEAFGYLERLYSLVKENYSSWLDYYLSYLKGRALLFDQSLGDSYDYILYLNDMYLNEDFFCLKYALS